jgi:hypothetical protein
MKQTLFGALLLVASSIGCSTERDLDGYVDDGVYETSFGSDLLPYQGILRGNFGTFRDVNHSATLTQAFEPWGNADSFAGDSVGLDVLDGDRWAMTGLDFSDGLYSRDLEVGGTYRFAQNRAVAGIGCSSTPQGNMVDASVETLTVKIRASEVEGVDRVVVFEGTLADGEAIDGAFALPSELEYNADVRGDDWAE